MKQPIIIITMIMAMLCPGMLYRAGAQLPQCDRIYIEGAAPMALSANIFTYDPTMPVSPTNPVLNTITYPTNMEQAGLAVSRVLGSASATRTFYTLLGTTSQNMTFWYYNPATLAWVNTGHNIGNSDAINIAAGGPYIYGLVGATGEVYQYDGTANGTLLVTVSNFTGEGPYDLLADCDGNFYIFNGTGFNHPRFLRKYSATGALLQSWTVNVFPDFYPSGGFAIMGNSFFTDYQDFNSGDQLIASGTLSGTALNITTSTVLPGLVAIPDMGSCDAAIDRIVSITIAATDTVMCGQKEVTYSITGMTNEGSNPLYQWLVNGTAVAGATNATFLYTPQNGDVVACRLTTDLFCVTAPEVKSNELKMIVEQVIQPELKYRPDVFCTDLGSTVLPMLNSPGGAFTAGSGLSIDPATGLIDPALSQPGTYTITYTNPPAVVCPNYSTTATVTVYPPAKAAIEVGDFEEPVCLYDTVILHALETAGNLYSWEPAARISGHKDKANAVVRRNESGFVYLSVTGNGGCSARDSVFIDQGKSCCTVFTPNAFTPNADGLNDVWITQTRDIQKINSLRIFNRYGQLVFERYHKDDGWDGTYNRAPCDAGVYHYMLIYTCDDGTEKERKGDITLVR